MPERHSDKVGGSTAARKLNCPGADLLIAQVPKVANRDSFYSLEGVALHTVMEMLITEKVTIDTLPMTIRVRDDVEVTLTPSLLDSAVKPAWAYWQDLMTKVDHWMIEAEVDFPRIAGAFGTADILARDEAKNITYVSDWKFGAGKGVTAVFYGDVPNEQLMFYACAARNTYPDMFPEGCSIVLTIIQPRARDHEPITSVEVTMDDLDDFEEAMVHAMTEAHTAPGRWCDFQPCKTVCPHHTGPLLDLSTEMIPTLPGSDYLGTVLRILDAAPIAEALIKEARAQAHLMLADGLEVPGWKIVAKRGIRQWALPDDEIMKKLKVKKGDFYVTEPRSPAQLEKLLRIKVPTELAPSVSSGTTLAPVSDKRLAISAEKDLVSKLMIDLDADQS